MTMTIEDDIYKAEHDCIAQSYEFLQEHANDGQSAAYIIGLNELACALITRGLMNKKNGADMREERDGGQTDQ